MQFNTELEKWRRIYPDFERFGNLWDPSQFSQQSEARDNPARTARHLRRSRRSTADNICRVISSGSMLVVGTLMALS